MVDKKHIADFCGPLKEILLRELENGNRVHETWQGPWPYPNAISIALAKPFQTEVRKDIEDVIFTNINDMHYWKAQYYDKRNNMLLICNFSSPDDLKYDF